ncbi:N-acetylglucosamine kinase [Marivirga sp. S37H4]|uniref:N-acetylglucosamine kinase n=1 Tax=Marivirga aurantiaca TaxID=2802615 RepID=A0A935C8P1_9BACT|nr:BadF/BadG/BcrA/BcrD ATPase family protein [Marivirga aurantiaca]MBK6265600.1 N-acetylglucosamine kinase [Marivirga aurantiaca]
MQIIAESGASKTDWRWIKRDGAIGQTQTSGINAYHISKDDLLNFLSENLHIPNEEEVTNVYYYGAGCGSQANKEKIKSALESFFNTNQIEVQHDLLAAARSTCHEEAGIICILGTGANACVYDGKQITKEMVSLGYVMGDEGSGAYIGRKILKAYLERELPDKLHEKFTLTYPEVTIDEVNKSIYEKAYPNRYLAGFFRFTIENQKEKYIYQLIRESFQEFIEKSVLKFDQRAKLPIHFVGGVAFHANGIMRQVLQENQLITGRFLESPIAGLTLYHQNISS